MTRKDLINHGKYFAKLLKEEKVEQDVDLIEVTTGLKEPLWLRSNYTASGMFPKAFENKVNKYLKDNHFKNEIIFV